MTDIVQKALEKIEHARTDIAVYHGNYDVDAAGPIWIERELAAMIRAAAEPMPRSDYCRICGSATEWPPSHAPDCALIALCTAIAPGVEE